MEFLKRLVVEEEGQGLVEYALIIGLVAVVLIGGLVALEGEITGVFKKIGDTLKASV